MYTMWSLVLLLNCAVFTFGYNILAVFPYAGKSHVDVYQPLTKGLARKGHNVTVISYFPLKEKLLNYHDVDLSRDSVSGLVNVVDLDSFIHIPVKFRQYLNAIELSSMADTSCRNGLSNKNLQDFLLANKDRKFDAVIFEFFNTECFLGIADRFKAPIIGLSSTSLMPWINNRFANPDNPSYIPNNHLDYNNRMSFFERVENLLGTIFYQVVYDFYINNWIDDHYAKKYLDQNTDQKSMKDLALNSSLLLVNSHFSLHFSRPLVPGIVEIGGIHVGKPNPLPKDIEKWINDSPEGVIYFSLGSMIKGHTFPEHKRQAFLRAFAKFKQRVLWKWENETMPDKPDNVMIKKWMPQFDILSHPNVRAFISHGGLLGTIEAVHCGVPILVMPQFGDQHTNAKAVEANGGGVILYLSDATEETITKALRKILNSDFRQKTKELSERFRDRPMSPLDTAIYWVEYVARHKGAPHLRTAAVDMPWYVYHLIDVWLFLITVALIGAFISIKIGLFILRYIGKVLAKDKEKTS